MLSARMQWLRSINYTNSNELYRIIKDINFSSVITIVDRPENCIYKQKQTVIAFGPSSM